MNSRIIKLNHEWLECLTHALESEYMQELSLFLREEKAKGKVIYPSGSHIFAALDNTPLSMVRVVVLGQDPYHGPNQAHGLSFSVLPSVAIPPSLKNIYKELQSDLGFHLPAHGHLQSWADQGVLLLNSVLTVEQGRAASHQGRGWEGFTDEVIKVINEQCSHVVFLLWGAYAQKKGQAIDTNKHLVLKAPHPSPLSAHRGFLGCGHFSKANQYLLEQGYQAIDWQIK